MKTCQKKTIVKTYRDLIIWQKAHRLVLDVYKLTKIISAEEKYGLISQIRRAAVSVPTNIVEGHSRRSKKEFTQFLTISRASLMELDYLFLLCHDLEYINEKIYKNFEERIDEISRMLYAFRESLNKSVQRRVKSVQ